MGGTHRWLLEGATCPFVGVFLSRVSLKPTPGAVLVDEGGVSTPARFSVCATLITDQPMKRTEDFTNQMQKT